MTVIVEFDLRPESFPVGDALAVSGVEVELERVVPVSERTLPLFWATASNERLDRFADRVSARDVVADLHALERHENTRLYEIEWVTGTDPMIEGIDRTGATVLDGTWDEEWRLRLRFVDRDAATAFSDHCTEQGVDIDVQRVYVPDARPDRNRHVQLTDKQREALELAVEEGYFATPKETSLSALADRLGISQQALSTRIRRGNERVLRATLARNG
jgi:hypothetical protein